MDTPWRMFLQVIRLCGRPHNQRSVTYPSYKSTQTGTQSAQCVFGLTNWNKQMIKFSRLLHNPGETPLMNRRRKTTDSAPRLQCYNIDTHQEIKYAHLHFKFIQKQQQQLIVVSLNCHQSTQARRTVSYIHTHVCILSVYTHMHKQTFGWLLHLDASQISLFLIQECVRGQPVQHISHKVCTTIYIIYTQLQLVITASETSLLGQRQKSSDIFPSRDTKHQCVNSFMI